jgi:hypothetical protein
MKCFEWSGDLLTLQDFEGWEYGHCRRCGTVWLLPLGTGDGNGGHECRSDDEVVAMPSWSVA